MDRHGSDYGPLSTPPPLNSKVQHRVILPAFLHRLQPLVVTSSQLKLWVIGTYFAGLDNFNRQANPPDLPQHNESIIGFSSCFPGLRRKPGLFDVPTDFPWLSHRPYHCLTDWTPTRHQSCDTHICCVTPYIGQCPTFAILPAMLQEIVYTKT